MNLKKRIARLKPPGQFLTNQKVVKGTESILKKR